jgi:hypothetical protein
VAEPMGSADGFSLASLSLCQDAEAVRVAVVVATESRGAEASQLPQRQGIRALHFASLRMTIRKVSNDRKGFVSGKWS